MSFALRTQELPEETALRLALDRGMFLAPSGDVPDRCRVWCQRCGWGGDWGFDVVTSKYAAEPYGCHPCRLGGAA